MFFLLCDFELLFKKCFNLAKAAKKRLVFINDRISIKKSILGYGIARPYLTANVKNFHLVEVNSKSYVKVFNDSFWVIGRGALIMETNNEKVNFGSQLNPEEAKKLIKLMVKIVKKHS